MRQSICMSFLFLRVYSASAAYDAVKMCKRHVIMINYI